LKADGLVVGVGEMTKASIVVTWKTDEAASNQIEYGQGTGSDYPNKTQEDNRMTFDHTVTIPDLQPGTVYHLRVLTKDRIGNLTKSYDNVVLTPKATRSAFDLVVDNLSKSFGFLGNLKGVVR